MQTGKWLIAVILFSLATAVTISGFSDAPSTLFTTEWPSGDGIEKPSPANRIQEEQVHVYSDRVVIELDDARWAKFTDTNSMDPVIDKNAHAIQIVPNTEDEIAVGDIISYSYNDRVIIHRVFDIGFDENGWYAITKGDNLKNPDKDKVRFEKVEKILVGILY